MVDQMTLDEVLTAASGLRVQASGWLRANCPFCLLQSGKADRRASLGVKPKICYFACFKCGARGTHPGLAEAGVQVAVAAVAKIEEAPNVGPPEGFARLDGDAVGSVFFDEPVRYLRSRGITDETVIAAGLGAVLFGYWGGRIVVPVLDAAEQTWLGFSARDWTNKSALRYRYPKGMARGKLLYNEAAVYRETDQPLLLVEGVFDALPYWPDAVACLGKPGAYHKQLLLEARRPIAVCLDGDAHHESWATSEYLRLHDKVAGAVQLPPGADPNTVPTTWLREESIRCLQA